MSSPEERPRPVPQGHRMAAICRLSTAVTQSATPATGWEGDKEGAESGGGGAYRIGGSGGGDNRCLLKPQGTSLKASCSYTLPDCNWWCPDSSSLIHITTVCHVAFSGSGQHSVSPLSCAESDSASLAAQLKAIIRRHLVVQTLLTFVSTYDNL